MITKCALLKKNIMYVIRNLNSLKVLIVVEKHNIKSAILTILSVWFSSAKYIDIVVYNQKF